VGGAHVNKQATSGDFFLRRWPGWHGWAAAGQLFRHGHEQQSASMALPAKNYQFGLDVVLVRRPAQGGRRGLSVGFRVSAGLLRRLNLNDRVRLS